MRFPITFFLLATAASLVFAGRLHAATYTEPGDAGDLPATAQVISGPFGTPLTQVSGALTLTSGISDSDMYQIYIANPAAFSVSDTAFVSGSNNFDSQIALFNASGVGVITNDDAASGGSQSSIAAGSVTGSAGLYYLLVSGSGRYAVSASGLIFPNYTDGTTDPTGTYGPTGPGGGGAISGYTGNSNEAGNYVLALQGAQFVPEPGAYACVLAGTAGLLLVMRARRTVK